jgi:thioredoxin reductase
MMETAEELPVVVVGAGPVGLAAAAQLVERGLPFLVVEAGLGPGAAVAEWGHVRVFSPWRYDIDGAARRLLEAADWTAPDLDVLPTGHELVSDYLAPLAKLAPIADRLRLATRVQAVSRLGVDRVRSTGRDATPFLVRVVAADGTLEDVVARAVIDASGTWHTPNPLGASGLPAFGEPEAADLIAHALPDVTAADRDRYAGRHTLVVGAGHSAATTLLALAELAEDAPGTRVSWAIRSADAARTYGGGDADELPARGALGSRLHRLVSQGRIELRPGFFTQRVERDGDGLRVISVDPAGVEQAVSVDRVVAATGFRPDHSLAAELRLDLDPILGATRALAPLIDPNLHSCGTVPPHGVDELTHP